MKLRVYSVFDRCSGVYDMPSCFRTDGEARRAFVQAASNGDTMVAQSPEDFTLFHVGFWNDGTGEIEAILAPVKIVNASEALVNGGGEDA